MRRSLFTGEEERSKFLNELVTGTTQIMSSQQGLSLHSNYHEFCRLLGRLKTNYQLAELVRGCIMPSPWLQELGSTLVPMKAQVSQGVSGSSCFANSATSAYAPHECCCSPMPVNDRGVELCWLDPCLLCWCPVLVCQPDAPWVSLACRWVCRTTRTGSAWWPSSPSTL